MLFAKKSQCCFKLVIMILGIFAHFPKVFSITMSMELDACSTQRDKMDSVEMTKNPASSFMNRSDTTSVQFWPSDGIIPYQFSDKLTEDEKNVVEYGMRYISSRSCVRFKERSNEEDYLHFTWPENGAGCRSSYGRQGGRQDITINLEQCSKTISLIINLAYAVGLNQEHRRGDRDLYITLHTENIKDDKLKSFEKYEEVEDVFLNSGLGYDHESILHAGKKTASKNGLDTLVSVVKQIPIGQRNHLSRTDILKLNLLFCQEMISVHICLSMTDSSNKMCLAVGKEAKGSAFSDEYLVELVKKGEHDGQAWTIKSETILTNSGSSIVPRVSGPERSGSGPNPLVLSIGDTEEQILKLKPENSSNDDDNWILEPHGENFNTKEVSKSLNKRTFLIKNAKLGNLCIFGTIDGDVGIAHCSNNEDDMVFTWILEYSDFLS